MGGEPRQTTSVVGHLNKPSIQALVHGLNRHYYSIGINYRKNILEQKMLLNLHKNTWTAGLALKPYDELDNDNVATLKKMLTLAKNYQKWVEEEATLTPEKRAIQNVGKKDPKRHLQTHVEELMSANIVQTLGAMIDTIAF